MKIAAILAATLVLGGCASLSRAMEFNGSQPVTVQAQGHELTLQHHRTEQAIAVTRSLSSAMGQGAISGLTFGLVGGNLSPDIYRAGAQDFLASQNCSMTQFLALGDTSYEAHYRCPEGVDLKALMGPFGGR